MTMAKPMSDSDAKARIDWLCREIDRHDRLYYVEAKPVIGDRDYDLLYNELLDLEKRYPPPFRWWERWALRHARAVIVCNAEAGQICQRKGFPGVPDVIPLGVDVERFSPVDREPPVAGA